MTKFKIVCCGAIGGCCPTIAKLGSYYSAQLGAPWPEPSVLIAMLLFAILGSIVAFVVGSNDVRAAIIAGIAAPGIVTNIVGGQPTPHKPRIEQTRSAPIKSRGTSTWTFGIKNAIAQTHSTSTSPPSSNPSRRTITVHSDFVKSGPVMFRFRPVKVVGIQALKKKDGEIDTVPVGAFDLFAGSKVFQVPSDAEKIRVARQVFDLKDLVELTIRFRVRTSFKGDFFWALGKRRNFDAIVVGIEPTYNTESSRKTPSNSIEPLPAK